MNIRKLFITVFIVVLIVLPPYSLDIGNDGNETEIETGVQHDFDFYQSQYVPNEGCSFKSELAFTFPGSWNWGFPS